MSCRRTDADIYYVLPGGLILICRVEAAVNAQISRKLVLHHPSYAPVQRENVERGRPFSQPIDQTPVATQSIAGRVAVTQQCDRKEPKVVCHRPSDAVRM
jgi:hypothetical protein